MVFSSLTFLCIFLPVVIILDRIFRNIHVKNALLLIASLIFYSYGEPVYVILMISSAFVNYLLALLIDKLSIRRILLTSAVVLNIGALVFFKYSVFLITFINDSFGLGIPVPGITLPLGISFFTFQAMSYVIDVFRGDCKVQRSFARVLLYISFFPQLIAGPIVKYRDIEEEITSRAQTPEQTALGIRRFTAGLSKKVFIANSVAVIADSVYAATPENISTPAAWLAALAYMLQIYFDFSGYSDMAIGLGLIFGFHFKENFNYPYISGSVKEFWRRWHISLSTWFKEYLYIPLGGNRKGKGRTVINKFIVFACTGIWHGANWTFLLWGLYHGAFLMLEELIPKRKNNILIKVFSHVYLILVVMIGFVLFRCDTLSEFGMMISRMFTPVALTSSSKVFLMSLLTPLNITALLAGIVLSAPIGQKLKDNTLLNKASYVLSLAAVVLVFMSLSSGSYNPFIYFRF